MKLPVLLLGLAIAGSADAYTLKKTSKGATVRWTRGLLPIAVVECGDPAKDQMLLDAARKAASVWAAAADVAVDLRVLPPGSAEVGFDPDGHNESVIAWAGGAWPFDESALALTFVHYDSESGALYDADVLINDEHYAWAGDALFYDLQNTITHELGHALGLGHSEIDRAAMFPSTSPADTSKRVLHRDDEAAAQMLYGLRVVGDTWFGPPIAAPDYAYGCTAHGGRGSIFGALLLGALLVFRRRRSALVAALLVAGLGAAEAAEQRAMRGDELAGLAALSDGVVRGRVVAQRVERGALGFLVTISTIAVEECVAGSCPASLEIEQLGGELDGISFAVEGITPLPLDRSLVLFTRADAPSRRHRLVELDRGLRAADQATVRAIQDAWASLRR